MSKRHGRSYDLVILGGGSAAFAAAIRTSEAGRTAALIERGTIGGTCVNVGCVPSKHLLVAGETYRNARENPFRSLRCTGEELDFHRAIRQKDEVVTRLRNEKYIDVLKGLDGIDLLRGSGIFTSQREVKVDGRKVPGRSFLIATGSWPWVPPIPGLKDVGYWTNVEGLEPDARPDSLMVIGGRALGLEFAQMYAHLGSEVTLLQRSDRIIPDEEPACSEALQAALTEEGVEIVTRAEPMKIHRENGGKAILAQVGGKRREFHADEILMATGRRPNTAGLNLTAIGVKVGRGGAVKVNREMRTTVPHIYAAGDVRGGQLLETTAAKEGFIAAENSLLRGHRKMDPGWHIPRAIFTSPQFAAVGYTEAEFLAKAGVCSCRTLPLDMVPKARIVGDSQGVVKMTIDPRSKRVVGVQMVFPDGRRSHP